MKIMNSLDSKIENELAGLPILQYGLTDPQKISFSERVRYICETECPRYDTSWSCPPAVGSVQACEDRCRQFTGCFVFSTVAEVNDAADMRETLSSEKDHEKITRHVADIFRKYYRNVLVLAARSCDLCQKCSWPDKPCLHPDKMFPCVESYGILVTDLAKQCGLAFDNGPNTVTWFGLVFFD